MNSILKVIEEGKKAYYDDIIRYKNPYENTLEERYWFYGYDLARSEHNLFTINQQLKEENSILINKIKALEQLPYEIRDDINTLRNDIDNIKSFFFRKKIKKMLDNLINNILHKICNVRKEFSKKELG